MASKTTDDATSGPRRRLIYLPHDFASFMNSKSLNEEWKEYMDQFGPKPESKDDGPVAHGADPES